MEAYRDTGYKSLLDKMLSCGGRAIVVTNAKMKMLVTNQSIGEAMYIKAVLKETQGEGVVDIPMKVYTYSKNLNKAAYTSALVGRL